MNKNTTKKDTKITVKIDRDVYKQLQQLKLDTDSKTISDAMKYALNALA